MCKAVRQAHRELVKEPGGARCGISHTFKMEQEQVNPTSVLLTVADADATRSKSRHVSASSQISQADSAKIAATSVATCKVVFHPRYFSRLTRDFDTLRQYGGGP